LVADQLHCGKRKVFVDLIGLARVLAGNATCSLPKLSPVQPSIQNTAQSSVTFRLGPFEAQPNSVTRPDKDSDPRWLLRGA
jgi:hypothetical protein